MADQRPAPRPLQLETLHRSSLALLIFFAGLSRELRRIRGMVAAGLGLASAGVLITLAITALALLLLAPWLGWLASGGRWDCTWPPLCWPA